MDAKTLRHKDVWSDEMNGFPIEICRWFDRGGNEKWNYYIYFMEQNTSPEQWQELKNATLTTYGVDYSILWISNLNWHRGITSGEAFYDKDKHIRCIKAGCDYSHAWDDGNEYTLEYVLCDCENTVLSIIGKGEANG